MNCIGGSGNPRLCWPPRGMDDLVSRLSPEKWKSYLHRVFEEAYLAQRTDGRGQFEQTGAQQRPSWVHRDAVSFRAAAVGYIYCALGRTCYRGRRRTVGELLTPQQMNGLIALLERWGFEVAPAPENRPVPSRVANISAHYEHPLRAALPAHDASGYPGAVYRPSFARETGSRDANPATPSFHAGFTPRRDRCG